MNFKKITERTFVFEAPYLFEDRKAVNLARVSRNLNLENKFISDVEDFLKKNVLGYGHSSIAEMACPAIYIKGVSWLQSNIVMDDKSFIGQELSTRAVNLENVEMSYICPESLRHTHNFYLNLFKFLKEQSDLKGSYKYDDIRWALPGSYASSVVTCFNARALIRHVKSFSNLSLCKDLTSEFISALKSSVPILFECLWDTRLALPKKRWQIIEVREFNYDIEPLIEIIPPKNLDINLNNFTSRENSRMLLDDTLNKLGMFKLILRTPISAARDWMRHRMLMPFEKKLLVRNGYPCFNNGITIPLEFRDGLNSFWPFINDKTIELNFLHQLPFGTLIELECYTSLNYLVYALELRSRAHGVSKEYSVVANQGLKILYNLLGPDICNYFSIYYDKV